MADNNLTPTKALNDHYKKLIGHSFEDLIKEVSERCATHKERLLAHINQPNEVRAYIATNRFDVALARAIIELRSKSGENFELFASYKDEFFDWNNIQQYVQNAGDIKSKIIYLLCLKNEIETQSQDSRFQHIYNRHFQLSEKCGFELSQLETQLMAQQQNEENIKKIGSDKENGENDFDTKKKLRAAIVKAHTDLLESFKASDVQKARRKEIVKETIDYLLTNPDSITFDKILRGLANYLKSNASIDLQTSHRIFEDVREFFALGVAQAKESGAAIPEVERMEFMYNIATSIAVDFFEEIFSQELKKIESAEQSRIVKEWQAFFPEHHYPFAYAGLNSALKEIQDLKEFYGEIEPEEKNSEESKDFSLRRKVLFLLVLTYNKLELPQGVAIEQVGKMFHNFTGGDIKRVKGLLEGGAEYKKPPQTGWRQSINNRIADLEDVQNRLRPLKRNDALRRVGEEITSLKKILEEN